MMNHRHRFMKFQILPKICYYNILDLYSLKNHKHKLIINSYFIIEMYLIDLLFFILFIDN